MLAPRPVLEKGWASPVSTGADGEAGAHPDAHLDGVLPGVVLGEQLISIRMQFVDGLLLLLQLPVDEVLDGERRESDSQAKRGDPGCILRLSYSGRAPQDRKRGVPPMQLSLFLPLQTLLKM